MSPVTLTREELSEIVEAAVRRAVETHVCRFTINPGEVEHIRGMLSDLGEGDLRRGVERSRQDHIWLLSRISEHDAEYTENHRWVSRMRQRAEAATTWLARGLVMAFLGLILYLISRGLGLPPTAFRGGQ